jgi:hypothetical protein
MLILGLDRPHTGRRVTLDLVKHLPLYLFQSSWGTAGLRGFVLITTASPDYCTRQCFDPLHTQDYASHDTLRDHAAISILGRSAFGFLGLSDVEVGQYSEVAERTQYIEEHCICRASTADSKWKHSCTVSHVPVRIIAVVVAFLCLSIAVLLH